MGPRMTLTGLLPALLADDGVAQVLDAVAVRGSLDVAVVGGLRAPLLAAASRRRPVVAVTATGRQADDLAAALRGYG